MIIFFVLIAIFLLTRDFSRIYALSSVLPQTVRRGWIRRMHNHDYHNWQNYDALLKREFPYYKLLNPNERSEFMVRMIDAKNFMVFEAREGLELDNRKLVLLAASMVQLTFGFRDYRLVNFEKIIVFPGIFYSKMLDQNVKGLTYGTGFVYLSWEDFEEGYEFPDNKINLGLHEFAHALMLQKPKYFETFTFDKFTRMANFLMQEMEDTGESNPLFRDYGLSNHSEFWAVCVEVFFEQPLEFRERYPNLYKVTTELLRQDMARRHENQHSYDESLFTDRWTPPDPNEQN